MSFTWPPDATTILLLWPIVTALISLVYNKLDGIPRVHAFLAVLVKAGVDLPAILDALKRILTGQSAPAQRAAKVAREALAQSVLKTLSVLCLLVLVACAQAIPAAVAGAPCVATVIQDAISGMTVAQIVAAAGPGCVKDAEDVFTILLGSSEPKLAGTRALGEARAARGIR